MKILFFHADAFPRILIGATSFVTGNRHSKASSFREASGDKISHPDVIILGKIEYSRYPEQQT